MKQHKIRLITAVAALSMAAAAAAQTLGLETVSQIAKSDPLIISGSMGTRNTYYHSSVGDGYRSPLSNVLFANLNISLYGISMPFSFYYSNDNTSFNYPYFSFNLNPHYKNWTGHLGRSSMAFSTYLMNMSFNGVGLEYNDSKRVRIGAFYGTLRSAVNDDPGDPSARRPQYKRTGWGFKVGYGNQQSYLDLYLLRAYDSPSSLDEGWRRTLTPQENLAVAVKGAVRATSWLSLSGNVAMSAFTADREGERLKTEQTRSFDKVFDTRYTSLARFAGDVGVNFSLKGINASFFYRMVQPDYTSLGTYYMANNYQSIGFNFGAMLAKRLSLTASFSEQHDNLSKNQLYTTSGYVYSANLGLRLGQNFNIMAGFNGYLQNQSDGQQKVAEEERVKRVSNSLYLTPSYQIDGDVLAHTFSLTGNFTENVNLNKLQPKNSNIQTVAAGANYSLDVKPWEMAFTTSLSHQRSRGYHTQYTSDILSLSVDRSFLREKNLTASATFSLINNNIEKRVKNTSLGADMALSYVLKKVHSFSLMGGYNKYSDVNLSDDYSSMNTSELSLSLNYVYTFSLLEITKKSEK